MAARRPLVLDASNRIGELPAGDTLIGVRLYLPVGLRSSGTAFLALSATYTLTVGLRGGGTFDVQATT